MNFQDALVQMQKGNYMARKGWLSNKPKPELAFACIPPTMIYVWKIQPMPDPNTGNFLLSVEDYQADDWMLLADRDAEVAAEKAALAAAEKGADNAASA